MTDRGEKSFNHLPNFAAKIYDRMMQISPVKIQISQIANELLNSCKEGRLLDIGTGHGRLLLKIRDQNSVIKLYGLDISEAMIKVAGRNLGSMNAELSVGRIENSPYDSNFFDCVTCTGSFYLWSDPVEALNEIYRILKPKCASFLYETYKDYDADAFKKALRANLKDQSFFNKKMLPRFIKKQLKMTYYMNEIESIIKSSQFAHSYKLEKIQLASLPIWMRISLDKN
jgi:ubiquinone/menaquinone biosynthesis C-methylase UbiE